MPEKSRILAVDDDPMNLFLLTEFLKDAYDIKTVTSGEEALDMVYQYKPDLILLDIMMPGIDGYEVCRLIRQDNSLTSVKIIFVSAKELLKERLHGYEVGAEDFIVKPFKQEELLAKLKVYLKFKKQEDDRNRVTEKDGSNNVFQKISEYFGRILYIKAQFPVCEVYCNTKDDPAMVVRTTLKVLEDSFNEKFLLRVHRSYLVNPEKIVGISKKGVQDYEMQIIDNNDNIINIPIGRKYHEDMANRFPKFFNF
ncbi:MAG: response regulator transcription factor [Deltaproteobacteria bacterium]|jgi:CheY-like chemotaxis protein|nr:response regulator transcription factor [Deltaproteobacteria bacterium]MBT4527528.1 response regulator transcription factor [Deltaproteobacteria bacterium]